MKLLLVVIFLISTASAQNLTPEEQRLLLKEVQDLKHRVKQLESKDSGQGFKTTDYQQKTTAVTTPAAPAPSGPAMSDEQRKEIMDTIEKFKKAQAEQEKALKELEDEE